MLRLVSEEPHNELAWLWLSDLAATLEERIAALERALAINPHRARAQLRLSQLRRQHAALALDVAAQAQALRQNGQRQAAYDLLRQRLQRQRDDAAAWQAFAQLADAVEDQIVALAYAVALDPAQRAARQRLTQLQRAHEDMLAIGSAYERLGDLENAIRCYGLALTKPPNGAAETIARKRLRAARRFRRLYRHEKRPFALPPLSANHALATGRDHEEAGDLEKAVVAYRAAIDLALEGRERQIAQERLAAAAAQRALPPPRLTAPTVTLARMTAGPALLYGLLIFIHAGLNPLTLSPVLGLGALPVLAGSAILVLVTGLPHHALSGRLLGEARRRDRLTRALLNVLGLLLLLIPFLLLLFSALTRLAAFEPVMP